MNRYEITLLFDIVSEDTDDYTSKIIVESDSEINAIKKVAISITDGNSTNVEWIKNMTGDLQKIICELRAWGYCFTSIQKVS